MDQPELALNAGWAPQRQTRQVSGSQRRGRRLPRAHMHARPADRHLDVCVCICNTHPFVSRLSMTSLFIGITHTHIHSCYIKVPPPPFSPFILFYLFLFSLLILLPPLSFFHKSLCARSLRSLLCSLPSSFLPSSP